MFKRSAVKIIDGLKLSFGDRVSVSINTEKPRRGSFVVSVNGKDPSLSLLAMARPFTALRNLDFEEAIAKISKAI